MKILHFFITKLFFKRWIVVLGMIILLFLANYLSFTTTRSVISTYQGYQEMKSLNQKGTFIANLDPDSESDFNKIELEDTKNIYEHLNNNYIYALQVNGFVSSLQSKDNMEVSFNYMNEESYKKKKFKLSQGNHLNFNYKFTKEEIPILVGAGLSKTYPVGSTIEIKDPVTQKLVALKVQGILEKNTHQSNFYAPNSKSYFNFAVFLPIHEDFIQKAGLDLHVNGLMELALLNTSKGEAMNLSQFIEEKIDVKFNFFSQQENFNYFEEYYTNSLKIICGITLILLLITVGLAIWNTLISIRLMIKDFTINLLVGLSYSKLRVIFYRYFALLFFINMIILCIVVAFNRYSFWLNKDAILATYGIFGLISMDWLSILTVILIDFIIGFIIVEITINKIKKIPISVGVLK